jgi:hypothetical protein
MEKQKIRGVDQKALNNIVSGSSASSRACSCGSDPVFSPTADFIKNIRYNLQVHADGIAFQIIRVLPMYRVHIKQTENDKQRSMAIDWQYRPAGGQIQ